VKQPDESQLIFDWARFGPNTVDWPKHVMLDDETLRDGLQSPSVIDPSLEIKVEVLRKDLSVRAVLASQQQGS